MNAVLRWLPTFVGFPAGGLLAELIVGPVDGAAAAVVGGAVTGLVLGAVQAWGLGLALPEGRRWALLTAAGLAVGLGVGSAVVDYGTETSDLVVQGAICGLAVGAAQLTVLVPRLGAIAGLWAPFLAGAWAIGWSVTAAIGVDVESQYTVFGSSGAVTVTLLTACLPLLLAGRRLRSAS